MVLSTEMRVLVDRNWEGGVWRLVFGGWCLEVGVWRCCSEVDVRRVGAWDLLPAVAHPYLRGPSSNCAKARPAGAGLLFYTHAATLESKLSSCRQGIKKAQPKRLRFCLFVIRLGFEPKTHSLAGCCSIQLSYRTDTYASGGNFRCRRCAVTQRGCKYSDFF